MRIEFEKLDFQDVLIRPKRSALSSRRDVELKRTFTLNILNKRDRHPHNGFKYGWRRYSRNG